MTRTIEIGTSRSTLRDLVTWVKSGKDVVLTEGQQPVARVIAPSPPASRQRRAGLHRGAITMAPDFDDPLPEAFWIDDE